MPYDYERSTISKATGLTGVEADHIANKLKELNIDPQTIDWAGAISDSRDWGSRYSAVKNYLANYYGISFSDTSPETFNTAKYNQEALEIQAATKKGVKDLLTEYYSTNSKQKKQTIKDLLLTEGPLYNVLMTAMYDGMDLPNARKFLNEAMQGEIINLTPAQVTNVEVKKALQKAEFEQKPVIVEQKPVIVEQKPVFLNNHKNNGNGKKTKFSINIEEVYQEIQKNQRARELKNIPQGPIIEQKPKQIKPGLYDVFTAGVKKEGDRWKKLLTQKHPKKGSIAALKMDVAKLRLQNLPLQLQLERARLLMQREQMIGLQRMYGQRQRESTFHEALSLLGFIPRQQYETPIQRPGYYVEARPKLPVGFRWKKLPKGKSKKNVSKDIVCPRCNIPMVIMPNIFGQPILQCPRCGMPIGGM